MVCWWGNANALLDINDIGDRETSISTTYIVGISERDSSITDMCVAINPDSGNCVIEEYAAFSNDRGTWSASSVPIPPALWLFGSGLLGLVGMARRKA